MTERIELTPENCEGHHRYGYERAAAQAHICNKCYNPQKVMTWNIFEKNAE